MAASFQTIAAVLINDRTDKVIHNLLQTDTAFWSKLPVKGRSDRKSTRLNSSHIPLSRMPSSA